jgi:hypothetical protein
LLLCLEIRHIFDVCEKYGDLVHWFDTKNLYNNFNRIIKIVMKEGIYVPASNHTIKKWNHPKTLEYMDGFKYCEKQARAAGVTTVNYNLEWCKNLVGEWKKFSLIKECIIPEGSDRNNHRQDQSVLEILYFKYQEIYKYKVIDEFIDLEVQKPLI